MSRRRPSAAGSRASTGGILGLRLLGGAAVGFGTFALGFLATYLSKSGDFTGARFGEGPSTEQYVSWMFFKMHNVGHQATASVGSRSESEAFDPSTWAVWEDWLFALPPALLLVAGLAVGVLWADGKASSGALYGASLVLGYLPATLVVALFSEYSRSRASLMGTVSVSAGPKLPEALALAGVVYPLVFGVVGGVVAGALRSPSTTTAERDPGRPSYASGSRGPERGRDRGGDEVTQGKRKKRDDDGAKRGKRRGR
jgi:hypothetical protein